MKISFATIALVLPLAALACDKSGAEAQQKADKAQAQANQEITNATIESDKKIDKAQATADKKIAEADRDFAKTRDDFRHTATTNLADMDKKLADLDAKAKKATGKKKMDIEAGLPTLRTQRDAYAADLKNLDTATAATWDATRARVEKEWSDLKNAADKLD